MGAALAGGVAGDCAFANKAPAKMKNEIIADFMRTPDLAVQKFNQSEMRSTIGTLV